MKSAMTLTLALIAGSTVCSAQETINPTADTIKWEYTQIKNVRTGEVISLEGYLTSYGGSRFEWNQSGYSRSYSFEQTAGRGEWVNLNDAGQLEYDVTYDGMTGVMRFSRNEEGLAVELHFEYPEKNTPHLILLVTNATKI